MNNMVSVAFINPLSDEGEMIVRELGEFGRVLSDNDDLMQIVTGSRSQEISDDSFIPRNSLIWHLNELNGMPRKRMIEILITNNTIFF